MGGTRKQGATIREVAKLARVSQMTVSRVLNNNSLVKETTRDRVQAAMRELNYRPNIMARNLAGRSGLFIGLIYRNPSYGYLSEFLLGALSACRKLGHYLIVEEPLSEDNMVDFDDIEKRFWDTSIQALIVVPPLSDDPKLITTLERTGIPFVCVSPLLNSYSGPSVKMDDIAAAREMTQYLLSIGHKRISLITGPPDHHSSALRLRGYSEAMQGAGQDIDESILLTGDFTYVSGMENAAELFSHDNPPTAIFASNDDMAAGVIAAAHQAGLRVPQDISIVGFDDTKNASSVWPPLTTIRQPIREMAAAAIETLSRNGLPDVSPDSPDRMLPYELVIRESSAPPPSSEN